MDEHRFTAISPPRWLQCLAVLAITLVLAGIAIPQVCPSAGMIPLFAGILSLIAVLIAHEFWKIRIRGHA